MTHRTSQRRARRQYGLTHIRMRYSLPASSEHQCRQWQCGVRFLETLVPNETFPAHRIAFPRSRCMLTSSHAYRSLCPPTTRTASRVGDFLTPYVKLKKKLNDFQWIKLFHVPPKKANFCGTGNFFRMA